MAEPTDNLSLRRATEAAEESHPKVGGGDPAEPVGCGVVRRNGKLRLIVASLLAVPQAKEAPKGAKIAARAFTVAACATTTATLRLPELLPKLLVGTGKLRLKLTATVTDPLGAARQVVSNVVAKAQRPKPKPDHHRKPSPKG
jgi:hypothetical protein